MKVKKIDCRVCMTGIAVSYQSVGTKVYWRCTTCAAVFIDASCLPDRESEYNRYLLHENDPYDSAYRNFLSKLSNPLMERLSPAREGLDYGCGPGPALARMLEEAGHHVRLYDPFFQPNPSALQRTYDFIVCAEAVEHFHRPYHEFLRLNRLIKMDGWLAIMTSFLEDDDRFANWHYQHDPTHVVFYCEKTFQFLAEQYGWRCWIPQKNVVLMQKTLESQHAKWKAAEVES